MGRRALTAFLSSVVTGVTMMQTLCIFMSILTLHSTSYAAIPSVKLEVVRSLNLEAPLQKGRGAFVSAASGLIVLKNNFYVVSDDEMSLFSFQKDDKNLKSYPLSTKELSVEPSVRKAQKGDFESLIYLSKTEWAPLGALVAWPSGSTLQRMKAVVIPFKSESELDKAIEFDIASLYKKIQPQAKELNIEGVVIHDQKVFLLQRGNSKGSKNGIFEMPFDMWIKGLKTGVWAGEIDFKQIKIGKLNDVKLTLSDGVWTKKGMLALAPAEDTSSNYMDGAVHGTMLVQIIGNEAYVIAKFEPIVKLEGIAIESETDKSIKLFLVDDADDPKKTSSLYKVEIPNTWLK